MADIPKYLRFGILSPKEIEKWASAQITTTGVKQVKGSVYDPRMGILENGVSCPTCGLMVDKCPGHMGFVELSQPVINPVFSTFALHFLKYFCYSCSKPLINLELVNKALSKHKRFEFARKLLSQSQKCCFSCGEAIMNFDLIDGEFYMYCGKKSSKVLISNSDIYDCFQAISNEDLKKFGFNDDLGSYKKYSDIQYLTDVNMEHRHQMRPEWFFFTNLPVIPPCARPYAVRDGGKKHDDDLTELYNSIIKLGKVSRKKTDKERKDSLFLHLNGLIDNSKKKSKLPNGRPRKSIRDRLNGKEGRVRGNIEAKRTDQCARSVIGGDTTLELDELGVPEQIAKKLTIPERVNALNIEKMRKKIRDGKALCVIREDKRFHLRINKSAIKEGDILERNLEDGDWVMFNRQPTLQLGSVMGFRVRIMKGKTFRINLSVTTPFNADFDGDEMNMHVPQTIQARAEIENLICVKNHIISAQSNSNVIGIVQDGLIASTLLTLPTTKVKRWLFYDCIATMKNIIDVRRLLKRAKVNFDERDEVEGRILFSALFPEKFNYKKDDVEIRNGILKNGIITKKVIGTKTNSIIHLLDNRADFITNLQFLVNRWFGTVGFSIGIGDCILKSENVRIEVENAQKEALMKSSALARLSTTTESDILRSLSSAVNVGQKLAHSGAMLFDALPVCINSGAKGSPANISQITAMLGQQIVKGGRVPQMISNGARSLPHFEVGDRSPEARGFVKNNYASGLSPTEVYFHAAGGREGLMDTAVGTRDTGYNQRKIVKKGEDLQIYHDGTVRNGNGSIVQFLYGSDGFSATKLFKVGGKLFFINLKKTAIEMSNKKVRALTDKEIEYLTKPIRSEPIKKILKDDLKKVKFGGDLKKLRDEIARRYYLSLAQAGDMVGIIMATSMGEIGTQLMLNNFHSAGLGKKGLTSGLPRFNEIMNVSKDQKTPSCNIYFDENSTSDYEKVFVEMIKDRGYVMVEKDTYRKKNKEIVKVVKNFETKMGKQDFGKLYSTMGKSGIKHYIVIISHSVTTQAQSIVKTIRARGMIIEIFHVRELKFNVTKHKLVPRHIPLTKKQKRGMIEKYGKEIKFPVIRSSDPVVKYYGLRRGDMVKIIRPAETTHEYEYYRIVL